MKTIILKIKRIFTYILVPLTITAFSQCQTPISKKESNSITGKESNKFNTAQKVSLISLIANPEKYDGKPIAVIGFLSLAFESKVLFMNKDDYDAGLGINGIWVEISNPEHYQNNNKHYVIIEGVFDFNNKGHLSGYIGAIDKITRIDNLYHPIKVMLRTDTVSR